MYKYSKKAEEKFFNNPVMAYLFIKFCENPAAKTQIYNKQPKPGSFDPMEDKIDVNMKQHEVNERILVEMNVMKQEASKILFLTFLQRVDKICINNLSLLINLKSIQHYTEVISMQCYDKEITVYLLEFLEVTAIDALIEK